MLTLLARRPLGLLLVVVLRVATSGPEQLERASDAATRDDGQTIEYQELRVDVSGEWGDRPAAFCQLRQGRGTSGHCPQCRTKVLFMALRGSSRWLAVVERGLPRGRARSQSPTCATREVVAR